MLLMYFRKSPFALCSSLPFLLLASAQVTQRWSASGAKDFALVVDASCLCMKMLDGGFSCNHSVANSILPPSRLACSSVRAKRATPSIAAGMFSAMSRRSSWLDTVAGQGRACGRSLQTYLNTSLLKSRAEDRWSISSAVRVALDVGAPLKQLFSRITFVMHVHCIL